MYRRMTLQSVNFIPKANARMEHNVPLFTKIRTAAGHQQPVVAVCHSMGGDTTLAVTEFMHRPHLSMVVVVILSTTSVSSCKARVMAAEEVRLTSVAAWYRQLSSLHH